MQNDNNQNPNSNAANNVVDSFFGPSDFDGEAPLGGEQKKKFKNHRRNLERQNAAAKAKAAEILGIERTNLHKKIKKYESNSFDTDESED